MVRDALKKLTSETAGLNDAPRWLSALKLILCFSTMTKFYLN